MAEFYPDRPVFDYSRGGDGTADCGNPQERAANRGRCGALDGPVFNSFINTPSYGDERAFFDGNASMQIASSYADTVQDVTEGDGDITLRLYVNNGANENFGARTTAQGTTARVALPTGSARALRARAYVSALNASPGTVEDTVDLIADGDFRVEYVPGSARLLRDNRATPLPDSLVELSGTYISTTGTKGEWEAGFDKAALIELRVRAVEQSDIGRWLLLGALGLVVLGIGATAARPASRHALATAGSGAWNWINRQPLAVQVVGTLVGAGLIALAGLVVSGLD